MNYNVSFRLLFNLGLAKYAKFPRVVVYLRQEYLSLSEPCKKALRKIEETKDIAEVKQFGINFGQLVSYEPLLFESHDYRSRIYASSEAGGKTPVYPISQHNFWIYYG